MSSFIETVFGGSDSSIIHLNTTESLSTITAAGWIQTIDGTYNYRQGDLVVAVFGSNETPGNFQVSIDADGVVTLVPLANLITRDVTVGQASLASGGSVIIMPSTGSMQFKIRGLQLNSGGTNFSGGGGDRLGQVTDNTTVYSVIPAASLQTLANAQWGTTALPNPASAAINTSTAAGADLVFKYSGGTTDYTAGSLVITALLERVA